MLEKNNEAKYLLYHVELKPLNPEVVIQWPPLTSGGRDVFLVVPFSTVPSQVDRYHSKLYLLKKTGKKVMPGGNEESDLCFSVVKALQCQLMDFQICKSDCP